MSGTLFICGTPLGNLEDISLRVLRIFKEADCIAAEDTRQTLKLLSHYEIKKPLVSYHEHNKNEQGQELLRQLSQGRSIALVTDAGMPAISDPGQELVALCHDSGIHVSVAPGPTAVTTALALSGLPAERFAFEGFLPRDNKRRKELLAEIAKERRTVVLYESPHHLVRTLEDLLCSKGDKPAAVIRELTKVHEEVLRANLSELLEHFKENAPRGEFVVMLSADESAKPKAQSIIAEEQLNSLPVQEHMDFYMGSGMDKKSAMKQVAKDRGVSKSAIYSELLDSSPQ
jgi:16S rRNA (cytidine1402-2'-O)-methyltransferase